MNTSSPNTLIFSCDDGYIERIQRLLRIIELSDIHTASSRHELDKSLGEHRSTVVILDTLYAEKSICELIREKLEHREPLYCICTCERSDGALFGESNYCSRLDMPYSVNAFFSAFFRARYMLEHLPPDSEKTSREREILLCVSEFLHAIGIPAHLNGCELLRCALCMTVVEPSLLSLITKDLYIRIAKKFSCTPVSVERSIRRTLDVAWKRGCMYSPDAEFSRYLRHKPTNSEFLCSATEYLRGRLGF